MNNLAKLTFASNVVGLLAGVLLVGGTLTVFSKPVRAPAPESEAALMAKVAAADPKLTPVIEALQTGAAETLQALYAAKSAMLQVGTSLCLLAALNLLANRRSRSAA